MPQYDKADIERRMRGAVEALIQAIRDLAADPAKRAAMGQAGRAVVADDFDIRTEAARLATLFTGQGDGAIRPRPQEGSA